MGAGPVFLPRGRGGVCSVLFEKTAMFLTAPGSQNSDVLRGLSDERRQF
ncbi:hypothetical protein HMPREF1548_04245 [Clostridium sp. KLE 1755]|nr:hypothetical protein HMPREF1548_04245 [Clostridium sp. KLE 1755]